MAAIVRIFFINRIHWSDATYTFVDLGIWLNVECNVGIVSACLPILPPLFNYINRFLKKLRHSVFSSKDSQNSHGSLMSKGSERADGEDGGNGAQGRKDERIKEVSEGSEMTSFALHTSETNEGQNVHLPD